MNRIAELWQQLKRYREANRVPYQRLPLWFTIPVTLGLDAFLLLPLLLTTHGNPIVVVAVCVVLFAEIVLIWIIY